MTSAMNSAMNLARSWRIVALSLVGVATASMAAPQPVAAGTYKMYSCNVPGRPTPTPSTAPWTAKLDGLNTLYFDDCVGGGSFGIGLNVKFMRSFSSASLALVRPDTGPKAVIGIVRYRTWITAELSGSGAPAFIDDGGAFSPPGGTTPDDAPWVSAPLAQTNPDVYVRLSCSAGDCWLNSARPLQARGIEVDLYEDVPPSGEIEGGTLFSATGPAPRTLSFNATDQESGVARVEALVGGVLVGTDDLDANSALCPHTDLNACPARYASDFVINPSTLPLGTHPVALRITDAAGNRRLVGHPEPVVGGVTAPVAARLIASFSRSRKTATTSYGRQVRVRGRLTDSSGKPIANGRVTVTEKFAARGMKPRSSNVSSGPDGRFTHTLSGKGPTRVVDLSYGGLNGGVLPASDRLRLRVRASSTLRVSLRGVIVRYAGRVIGRPLPRNGKVLYVQGRAVGGTWQRFAVRRTDAAGRFHGRYRLRVRRPGVKLQFRVEIPKQSGYAYSAGLGPSVTRVVR